MRTPTPTWAKWHGHAAKRGARVQPSAVERATTDALRDLHQRGVVIDLITRARRP